MPTPFPLPDQAAQREFVRAAADRHYPELLERAQRHPWGRALAHRTSAEDVVQEVFMRAIGSGLLDDRAGRPDGSLARALQVVLEHVLADHLRRHGAQKRGAAVEIKSLDQIREETSSPLLRELTSALLTPTTSARARELVDLCAKHLEDKEWKVWRLRAVAGLNFEEIGKALGCSAGAARGIMHRARKKLILALAELDPEQPRSDSM